MEKWNSINFTIKKQELRNDRAIESRPGSDEQNDGAR